MAQRPGIRRLLLAIAAVSFAWSLTLGFTGGVSVNLGPVRVSSHAARNPAIAALLFLLLAVASAPAGSRFSILVEDLALPGRTTVRLIARLVRGLTSLLDLALRPPVPACVAVLLALGMLVAFWQRGVLVAGGADSHGYVSEAHLFATGRMVQSQPLLHRFPHVRAMAWTPLGYRPAEDRDALIPTYSPGLPLTMAVAEVVGGPNAVYIVMPLLAALAVWFTYRLGTDLVGPGTGMGAALLLAASPALLFQLVFGPMSDIPAAGWWTIALALVLRKKPGRWAPALAGLAAGAAILTRPNLLLLAAVIGAYLLGDVVRARPSRDDAMRRLVWFSAGAVPACLAEAWFNATWYGSPLRSGYDSGLFKFSYWTTNVVNYPAWLTDSQTPLLLVGFAAPAVIAFTSGADGRSRRSKALFLTAFAAAVFLSYVFYSPFEAWWYLRFLLPAYPVLAVLTCATLAGLATRLGSPARLIAVALVVGAAGYGLWYSRDATGVGEYRYQLIAEYVRDRLPEKAIVVTMQHSGSMQHYSGREILRYDQVEDLDRALDDVQGAGYRPYLVVDEWEIADVRRLLGGRSVRGWLDWPPIAVLPLANVTVWDLAEDRDAARASGRTPETIAVPEAIRQRLP